MAYAPPVSSTVMLHEELPSLILESANIQKPSAHELIRSPILAHRSSSVPVERFGLFRL
jgi:hypothetical protein